MRDAYFAQVLVFDRERAEKGTADEVYGGDMRLFVLAADHLADALARLTAAIEEKGLRLDRVNRSAPVAEFRPDDFEFPLDIEGMADAALAQDRICASHARSFRPRAETSTTQQGICAGLVDLRDLSITDQGYLGHVAGVAAQGTVPEALYHMISDLRSRSVTLQSVEAFEDVASFDPAVFTFQPSLSALVERVRSTGRPAYSASYRYGGVQS